MWKWRGSWMWRERTCRLLAVTETPTGQLNCNVCPGVAFIMMLQEQHQLQHQMTHQSLITNVHDDRIISVVRQNNHVKNSHEAVGMLLSTCSPRSREAFDEWKCRGFFKKVQTTGCTKEQDSWVRLNQKNVFGHLKPK